jgi:hypothetical protein
MEAVMVGWIILMLIVIVGGTMYTDKYEKPGTQIDP